MGDQYGTRMPLRHLKREKKNRGHTVRHFEAAVDEEVIAGRIASADHHAVFHDLLCIQRHPLSGALLLDDITLRIKRVRVGNRAWVASQ